MWSTLRAFAWLRWRTLINSLEKTGARDTVERFSVAIEKLGPIMAAVLLVPSSLGLASLATAGGFALARGEQQSKLFATVRFLLFAVPIFGVIGPLLLPAADRTNAVRILLLPISRATLYVAQSAAAFGDVWIMLMLPVVLCVPLGLAVGGAPGAALITLLAGAVLVIVIIGISSLATSVLHLAVRDRRRGELLALIFIILVPFIPMLPAAIDGARREAARPEGPRAGGDRLTVPRWVETAGARAFALYPTELYVSTTRAAVRQDVAAAARRLAALAGAAALLHVAGMVVFARVLDSPGSTVARRAGPMRELWRRTLPGLSPGASAVALAHLRLALRTPRGRSILLSPLLMFLVVGVLLRYTLELTEFGPFTLRTGLGVASFTSFICLTAILPIAMNQFAVDRAGLTMALLSPLTDREYLAGKAVGNALIVGPPTLLCIVLARITFPGGSTALWVAIPLALLSVYLLVAPAAAILSAIFPRTVDMTSVGRGSNAHGLAGLLGLLSFMAAGAPCVLLLAAGRWIGRPALVPVLLLTWCAVAYVAHRLLFVLARRIFARRRENLAMLL
jgi:hypothetical protein